MKYIESIWRQKWKSEDGNIHRGLHIQIANHDGLVLGQSGYVDWTQPQQLKVARLKDAFYEKAAILSHPGLRDKADIDTGTDLLRLLVNIIKQNGYYALVVFNVVPDITEFYLDAFETLRTENTIPFRPILSFEVHSVGFYVPIRE